LLDDGVDQIATLRFVGDDGNMDLELHPSSWSLILRLDITSTPGKDYYSSMQIVVSGDKNITVFMEPVGSLMGEVIDPNNNLVRGASVKLECSGDYAITDPITTDEFGSFTAHWLPVGACKVSALNGKRAGSASVQISQGLLSDVQITLTQGVAQNEEDYLWLLALALAVLIVVIFLVFFKRKNPVLEGQSEPIKPDRHMNDILSALDENEGKIIKYLMDSGGKSKQNILCRELGVPKSSLSRAVSGLEARNLIKTEKLGRVKRVELSEWFLNGKRP
jgi:DNA-binding MarR family transcriptional regulator